VVLVSLLVSPAASLDVVLTGFGDSEDEKH
jgi:hypothetical protein